jgi:TatA/E family protein of Tat protein translocase
VIGDIFQPTHLLFLLVIVLIVLGPKRLPEMARALGRGFHDFKSAISGEDDHGVNELQQQQVAPAPSPPSAQAAVGPPPQDPVEGAG